MNALNINLTSAQIEEIKALIELKDKKDAENQAKADKGLSTGSLDLLLESCDNEYTAKLCELFEVNGLPVDENTIDKVKAIL